MIVCHHKGDFLDKFIPSVRASIGVTYEIIVITSDEALADKGISGCLVFFNTGLPAEKRNVGARIATAPILGFFDDDVEIEKHCLSHFVDFLIHAPEAGMVYGKLHNAERPDRFDEAGGYITNTGFIWSRAGQNDIDAGQFDKIELILAGKSASCAIKKYVFDEVKGFDEDFGILGEETDLSWRVWLKDYGVWFNPNAIGIHYFNTKWKPAKEYYTSERVHFNGCRNYLTMLIKNLGKEHLWIVPLHSLLWFSAAVALVCTGKVREGLNLGRGIMSVIIGLPKILRKRNSIQKERKIDETQLWPIIHRATPRGYYLGRFTRYIRIGLHG